MVTRGAVLVLIASAILTGAAHAQPARDVRGEEVELTIGPAFSGGPTSAAISGGVLWPLGHAWQLGVRAGGMLWFDDGTSRQTRVGLALKAWPFVLLRHARPHTGPRPYLRIGLGLHHESLTGRFAMDEHPNLPTVRLEAGAFGYYYEAAAGAHFPFGRVGLVVEASTRESHADHRVLNPVQSEDDEREVQLSTFEVSLGVTYAF